MDPSIEVGRPNPERDFIWDKTFNGLRLPEQSTTANHEEEGECNEHPVRYGGKKEGRI